MSTQPFTESSTINVLLSSFPGLGLPSTLCIPVSSTSTIADLSTILSHRLASSIPTQRLILTTASNKQISATSAQPLSSLLLNPRPSPISTPHNDSTSAQPPLLTLRLSAPLCGGKGGFGSQLRAAGGRMSSRKKNKVAADLAQLSARGPDGRRLRTVQEAKALAEYLAVKPEMEKKEKEERRKKWEAVVEAAERRTEEMLAGKGPGKGRGDAEWLERKEEAEQKVREEVLRAVREGLLVGVAAGASAGGASVGSVAVAGEKRSTEGADAVEEMDEDERSAEEEDDGGEGPSNSSAATTPEEAPQRKVFGWDEDDDEDDEEA